MKADATTVNDIVRTYGTSLKANTVFYKHGIHDGFKINAISCRLIREALEHGLAIESLDDYIAALSLRIDVRSFNNVILNALNDWKCKHHVDEARNLAKRLGFTMEENVIDIILALTVPMDVHVKNYSKERLERAYGFKFDCTADIPIMCGLREAFDVKSHHNLEAIANTILVVQGYDKRNRENCINALWDILSMTGTQYSIEDYLWGNVPETENTDVTKLE